MNLVAYCFLALSSLFVIVYPIATIPAFIAMTSRDSVASRLRMARLACLVTPGVLILFALSGQWIFRLLGINLAGLPDRGQRVVAAHRTGHALCQTFRGTGNPRRNRGGRNQGRYRHYAFGCPHAGRSRGHFHFADTD